MEIIAVVGGGPDAYLPVLSSYEDEVSLWIGADRGSLSLIQQGINPDIAIGDFDSIGSEEKRNIELLSNQFLEFNAEKDETDLELALVQAVAKQPDMIYLFGVTGGRLDHELANLQLLYLLNEQGIDGLIIDNNNEVRVVSPGFHEIKKKDKCPYISFLPMSDKVEGITLNNFYYPLQDATIKWGSTLCISNRIHGKQGTLEFTRGTLYIVQSRDPL